MYYEKNSWVMTKKELRWPKKIYKKCWWNEFVFDVIEVDSYGNTVWKKVRLPNYHLRKCHEDSVKTIEELRPKKSFI